MQQLFNVIPVLQEDKKLTDHKNSSIYSQFNNKKSHYNNFIIDKYYPKVPYVCHYKLNITKQKKFYEYVLDKNSDQVMINSNLISTDTRKIKNHQVFIALDGKNFKGDDFIVDAIKHKITVIITSANISKVTELINDSFAKQCYNDQQKLVDHYSTLIFIQVNCCITAYLYIANFHLSTLKNAIVIAISGSVGKTSLKNFLKHSLELLGLNVHCTAGNLNNQIGVCQTLLSARADHDFIIVEAGMRDKNDLKKLVWAINQDISILTVIDSSHYKIAGCQKDIYQGKLQLFYQAIDSIWISCCDDPIIFDAMKIKNNNYIAWVRSNQKIINKSSHFIKIEHLNQDITNNTYEIVCKIPQLSEKISFKTSSIHQSSWIHCINSMSVIYAINKFKLYKKLAMSKNQHDLFVLNSQNLLTNQIILPKQINKRFELIKLNQTLLIDDCYNASFSSIKAGLTSVFKFKDYKTLIIILGDMAELGDIAFKEHKKVAELLKSLINSCAISIKNPKQSKVTKNFFADQAYKNTQTNQNFRYIYILLFGQYSQSIIYKTLINQYKNYSNIIIKNTYHQKADFLTIIDNIQKTQINRLIYAKASRMINLDELVNGIKNKFT